ncbi:MAG: PAS domain-containing protein [Lewinellaceae bacterium]|nr:PAS domain-containing protein [Phaeodactylibacter sp.]MCB9036033.1 PAS domain-containing protein [Lewinellaceae bacterium]
MKTRTKFFLFLLPIHLAALALSFFLFREKWVAFILAETAIIASFLLCLNAFRGLSEPLELLLTGIDAIKDRDFNVKFIPTGKRETDRLIEVYNEMIDRLREERTLQEQQHFFLDKLIHTSPTGIIILDYDGCITELNPKARELLQLSPTAGVLGKPLAEIAHPVARVAAALPSGQAQTVNIQGLETYKCLKAEFVDRGFARPFIMVEELTAEILRAEKNAYGKVIRMMAHEVNNTIGAINSILQATLSYGDEMPSENSREFREVQQVCIDRNGRLNRFMRNFADIVRLPPPQREPYSLNQLLEGVARLMSAQAAHKGVAITLQLPAPPLYADIDVQQMEQVLVNAVKNAVEAVGASAILLGASPEANGHIFIRNNGPGIPPELEEQLFSPFFTTKKDGQGVGLTLSREILVNHGFGFSLRTGEDGWTEFRINL